MDTLINEWREHFLRTSPLVAGLQRKAWIYKRQRNILVSILVTILGSYIKRVMDGQAKL